MIVNSSGPLTWLIKLEDGKTVIRHADHIRNRYIQNNDQTFQEFEKNEINGNPQLPDSTIMPNQSNSQQQQNQQNQHKTLTIQILPQKKLVKRH